MKVPLAKLDISVARPRFDTVGAARRMMQRSLHMSGTRPDFFAWAVGNLRNERDTECFDLIG